MNRLLWGIAFLVLAAAGGWAQSTWRGQAEVWTTGSVPSTGFVAASNEFPKNSLLTVENYKTKKTVQVRVIQGLPVGSAALVLLNPRAAAALDMKAGDTPLVGVRLDPNGTDRPDNPDPDVNPLAEKPASPASPAVAEAPAPTPAPATTPAPTTAKVPAAEATPRVPAVTSLEVARGSTALDPNLMPLPALAPPATVPAPQATPLAVADEPETPAPVTPGKMVFVTAREPGAVAAETPAVTETPEPTPVVSAEPMASPEPMAEPEPLASAEPMAEPVPLASAEPMVEPVAASPEPMSEPVPEPAAIPEPAPAVAETTPVPTPPTPEPVTPEPVAPVAPVADAPASPGPVAEPAPPAPVAPAVAEKPVAEEAPVVPVPVPVPASTSPVAPLAVKPAPVTAWVPVAGKLEGPVLGQVAVLPSLDHGRSYVQVGAWADEASLLTAMATLKSFVPVALYRAEGEKNPWRLVVASAPKGQLGFLLMHFRSQGFRTAALVKG